MIFFLGFLNIPAVCATTSSIQFGLALDSHFHINPSAADALFIGGNPVLVTFLRSLSFWSSLSFIVSGTRVRLSLNSVTVTSLPTREDFENPSALAMARHGIDVIAVLAPARKTKIQSLSL
jgi:hypothetical protein